VTVETGDGGQRSALHLDDRDPEAGRVQNEPLEGLSALGDDEQADGRASGNERLLDRPATGDELFTRVEQADRGWGRRAAILTGPRSARLIRPGPRPTRRSTIRATRTRAVGLVVRPTDPWLGMRAALEWAAGAIERASAIELGAIELGAIETIRPLARVAERGPGLARVVWRSTALVRAAGGRTEAASCRSTRSRIVGPTAAGTRRPIMLPLGPAAELTRPRPSVAAPAPKRGRPSRSAAGRPPCRSAKWRPRRPIESLAPWLVGWARFGTDAETGPIRMPARAATGRSLRSGR
jgi:hypothetical protein